MADRGNSPSSSLSRQRFSSAERKKRSAEIRRVERKKYAYIGSEHARFLKFRNENNFTSTQAVKFLLDRCSMAPTRTTAERDTCGLLSFRSRYYQECKSGDIAALRTHRKVLPKPETVHKVPQSSSTCLSSATMEDGHHVTETGSSSDVSNISGEAGGNNWVNGDDIPSKNLYQVKLSTKDSDPSPQKIAKKSSARSLFWWLNSDTVSQLKFDDTCLIPNPTDSVTKVPAAMSGNGRVKKKTRLETLITSKCPTSNFPMNSLQSRSSEAETVVNTGGSKTELGVEINNASTVCSGFVNVLKKSIKDRQLSSPEESNVGQLTVKIKEELVDSALEYGEGGGVSEPHYSAGSKNEVESKPSLSSELNESAVQKYSEATQKQDLTSDYEPLLMECTDELEDKSEQPIGTLTQMESHSKMTKEGLDNCQHTGHSRSVLPVGDSSLKIASSHSIMDTMEGLVGSVINKYFSEHA